MEDTYFDDAVFLGDSRTEGFHLQRPQDRHIPLRHRRYSGVGIQQVGTTPLGRMPLLDALEKTHAARSM